MIALSFSDSLMLSWLVEAALGLAAIALVIIWAVKTGQFSDQDRARYLPLHSDRPLDSEENAPAPAKTDSGCKQEVEDHGP